MTCTAVYYTLTALASQLALTLALTTRTPSVQVVDSYTYREVDHSYAGLVCRALASAQEAYT